MTHTVYFFDNTLSEMRIVVLLIYGRPLHISHLSRLLTFLTLRDHLHVFVGQCSSSFSSTLYCLFSIMSAVISYFFIGRSWKYASSYYPLLRFVFDVLCSLPMFLLDIASFRLISFIPSPSASIIEPINTISVTFHYLYFLIFPSLVGSRHPLSSSSSSYSYQRAIYSFIYQCIQFLSLFDCFVHLIIIMLYRRHTMM